VLRLHSYRVSSACSEVDDGDDDGSVRESVGESGRVTDFQSKARVVRMDGEQGGGTPNELAFPAINCMRPG
jgi:hypothetical protein